MVDRMRWRRGHPDEPPFIVLHSLAIQPTPPVIPWIQPDAAHVENWREYQLVVAKVTLSYVPAEQVLCEWEILGQAQGQVYVWRICSAMGESGSLEGLATILIDADGSPQNAIDSGIGDRAYIQQTFPQDVQERYFSGLIHFQELVSRLHWRKSHPDDPPLIVVGLQSP
jgi:hypothetical protein